MPAAARPRLFSIAASRPFLPTLVDALLDGRLVPGFRQSGDPLALADVTMLVPTRRAARALREAFLAALGGRAAILPRIEPLGDIDEDALLLGETDGAPRPGLDPEVGDFERLLGMTRLVVGWSEGLAGRLQNPVTGVAPTLPASPAEAVHLARALLTLMDQVATEGADWAALQNLVPADYADYWALTLAFLDIVTRHWPAFLAERGLVDPSERRNRMIRAEIARLAAAPPAGPVIAAGSTGSIPATAELLGVVARLPLGAVVLPGLDFDLDADAWAAIGSPEGTAEPPVAGHPQYGLKLLLDRLGAGRDEVEDLSPEADADLCLRRLAVSEALKPARTTESWRGFAARAGGADRLAAAFAGVTLIEARTEGEEALAIALALREAIERPGATAALVTPDRALARRVSVELGRWGLVVDDSAGVPLARTPPAVLARLVAEVAVSGFDTVALVALLQHPLAAFGMPRARARRAARALELGALRGPRPAPGSAGLAAVFADARHAADVGSGGGTRAARRLEPDDWRLAEDLLEAVVATLAPLERLAAAPGRAAFTGFLDAHVAALRAAATDDTGSDAPLFDGEAGEALAAALAGMIEAARAPDFAVGLGGADYPGFFAALLGHRPVRRRGGLERRLSIWGPLEARLQSVDLLVLAGLDEGVWPATTRSDPWLSRPMKRDMALESPERRIGLAAHDFEQGIGAPRVILARALRAGSAPTVASRWLQRLAAVVGPSCADAMRARGLVHLQRARAVDRPDGPPRPVARPAPRPPVAMRPAGLSVTEIETWIRDPYAIHARHVLGLVALDPLAADPGAGDRGTLVHAVLARFVAGWTPTTPEAGLDRFLALAEDELARFAAFPEIVALWRPRLARMGEWFVGFEADRAPGIAERILENRQVLRLPVAGVAFDLSGRADRIDRLANGTVAILDYKTGSLPSLRQVQSLLSPQLPLEALMLQEGAFGDDLATRTIAELLYVRLSGTRDGGETREVTAPPRGGAAITAAELAERVGAKLHDLVLRYRDPRQGYASRPRIQFSRRLGGDYDHLARVKEWAAGEGGDE